MHTHTRTHAHMHAHTHTHTHTHTHAHIHRRYLSDQVIPERTTLNLTARFNPTGPKADGVAEGVVTHTLRIAYPTTCVVLHSAPGVEVRAVRVRMPLTGQVMPGGMCALVQARCLVVAVLGYTSIHHGKIIPIPIPISMRK